MLQISSNECIKTSGISIYVHNVTGKVPGCIFCICALSQTLLVFGIVLAFHFDTGIWVKTIINIMNDIALSTYILISVYKLIMIEVKLVLNVINIQESNVSECESV